MTVFVPKQRRSPVELLVVPLLVVMAWGIGLLASGDIEATRALVILSGLAIVSLLLFPRLARSDAEGRLLLVLLFVSFVLKLAAVYFRDYTGLLVDAVVYDKAGQDIAIELATGQWPESAGTGAGAVRLFTGLVYFVTGPTFPGALILWSWFGLLGMFLFYKAFSTAFPDSNRRLYMFLIFLYPSLLLWTSSLGKDALMLLFMGMAAYGAARLQRRIELIGLFWFALGIGGALMIRPHVAAIFAIAVGASALFRPIHAQLLTPVIRAVGVIVFITIAVVVVRTASGSLGLEQLSEESTFGFIEARRAGARGGSAFQQTDPRNVGGLAMLIPTILFRPFPWEAHNVLAAVAAVEGMFLLALMVRRWRSVSRAIVMSTRHGYLVLILAYVFLFIVAFSAIANFGILARQRASQLLPFVFMWAAYLPQRQEAGQLQHESSARKARS